MSLILTTQIAPNGGFENGNDFDNGTIVANAFAAHGGAKYLEFSGNAGQYATRYGAWFDVAPGDKLNALAYAHRVSGDAVLFIGFSVTDASYQNPVYPGQAGTPGAWGLIQMAEYTVPSGKAKARLYIQIGNAGTVQTVSRWDDIIATRTGPLSGADYVDVPSCCGTKIVRHTA